MKKCQWREEEGRGERERDRGRGRDGERTTDRKRGSKERRDRHTNIEMGGENIILLTTKPSLAPASRFSLAKENAAHRKTPGPSHVTTAFCLCLPLFNTLATTVYHCSDTEINTAQGVIHSLLLYWSCLLLFNSETGSH